MASPDQMTDGTALAAVGPIATPLRMTEEEFLAWRDEETLAEWVDGEVVVMAHGSIEHCDLRDWLVGILRFFVEHHRLGRVFSEAEVHLAAQRRRRVPDVVFIGRERLDRIRDLQIEGPADMAMEIVSPDSVSRDWREKYHEYAAAGFGEYWILDPAHRRVEAYSLSQTPSLAGGSPRFVRLEEQEGTLPSIAVPGFYLRPAWLWQKPPLSVASVLRELGVLN